MKQEIKNFINNYSDYIRNDEAAVFIGAGISRGSGFVNWKELLSDIAEELGLSVDKEEDLIELAQYHKNKHDNRNILNRKLIKEFTKETDTNEIHTLLSQMEVTDYWTTNYDTLIEDEFKKQNYRVDVKGNVDDIPRKDIKNHKTVYKMHGDISSPEKAILLKDDYETYADKWEAFSIAFKNALMQNTFLFLGFSFEDPNLKYILSRIKQLLSNNARSHYCIMKKVSLKDCDNDKEIFEYKSIKQQLKIQDLKRYSIEVILVNNFNEVNDILARINRAVKYNRIFISGAADNYSPFESSNANEFAFNLAYKIARGDNKLTSGFGKGIGSSIINGSLAYAFNKKKKIDDIIKIRPFPQNITDQTKRRKLWTEYRKEMLNDVGIAIFMFGNKYKNNKLVHSDGMLEEYEIAVEFGVKIIPLPFTGNIAKEIYNEILKDYNKFYPDLNENERFASKFNELSSIKTLDDTALDIIIDLIRFIQRSSSV
ncbi:MAG: SIR2 family protein [bacterium]